MKNLFLFLCMLLTISATAYAQQTEKMTVRPGQMNTHLVNPELQDISEPDATSQTNRTAPASLNSTPRIDAVTSFKIGESSNAFTFISVENNQIATAPGIGTGNGSVAFIYRHNIGECGGTADENGRYRYSMSTDGGLNWNVGFGVTVNSGATAPVGHCFGNGIINPAYSFRSRFPNLVFHATGATVADLNLVYTGPVLSPGAINGSAYFDGNVHGYVNDPAASPFVATQVTQEEYRDQGGDQLLGYSLVERVPGEYWYVTRQGDGVGNVTNGIHLNKGAYDAVDEEIKWAKVKTFTPEYSNHYLQQVGSLPLQPQMAFSPDGLTGYVAFLTDLKGGSDSTFSVGWMETTNGGITWTDPAEFNIRQFPELIEHINFFVDSLGNPVGTGVPTTAFDFDLVVDANGNPHIFAVVGNGTSYSIQSGLKMSVYDFTKDSFDDWNMAFVGDQGTFRWDWDPGNVSAVDPWMQASRSADGTVVYAFWTDTDTTGNFADGDNDQPDLKGWAMNVNTFMTTEVVNFTFDDANWSGRALMPRVAAVSFVNGNTHTVPVIVMDAPALSLSPVSFWYFSDVTFDAGTDFVNPAQFFYNCNQNPFANTINVLQPDCGVGNGALSITASGGITPYTYQWDAAAGSAVNDTVTGLAAGIYSVIVTDSAGCTDVRNIVLNNVGAPVPTIDPASITAITCAGADDGSATVVATGGTGTLSYLWSNGETTATAVALAPGQNIVTVTDANACAALITVSIDEPPLLTAALDSNNVTCFGADNGIVSVLASGGTGILSYLWDDEAFSTTPVINGVGPGTYTVLVTDQNGCTTTESIVVNEPAAMVIGTSSTNNLNANPPYTGTATATTSGGTAPYTYSWAYTGCAGNTVSATGAFIFLIPGGDYYLSVTDANGCVALDTVTVGGVPCAVSIEDELAAGIDAMNLFPNPTSGTFTVDITLAVRENLVLSVLDMRGKLVSSRRAENVNYVEETFNLNGLAKGIYLLRVETSRGAIARRVIVH